ncbi:unnamed protein product [Phytophthora fragariaefolia]|uniref:Unnamed protein product n=1 Tax=Phytophthora fragariaefolia TaxID=1490495 RepID=A0A9W6XYE0_9STRA|nr:unnamed protein product [Phytophthora fragariaefolia]
MQTNSATLKFSSPLERSNGEKALIIKPSVGFGSGAGSAGPSAYHVMEKDLKPWELYDLSGAEGPENLDAMKEYFTRYRQIRGKRTNNAYTHDAQQRRWNAAGRKGLSFASWLGDREATRSTRAIGDLRVRVCEMA